ncbi:unnamed protein product, partial [marine sediment metagenome]
DPIEVNQADDNVLGGVIKLLPALSDTKREIRLSNDASFADGKLVTVQIPYQGVADVKIEEQLRIFELNSTHHAWGLAPRKQTVDVVADTVSVQVAHFSVFRLAQLAQSATDLTDVAVFPNPVKFADAVGGILKFVRVTQSSTIRIYTLSGDLVKTLDPAQIVEGRAEWNGENENGSAVARGIYLYFIKDEEGHKTSGKIGVIKK